ncbi:helix-turn-helix domain-containing protein [Tumebacillus permanentifrigoris]|uniref:Helix-turn-helix protein n=1 Tax=Tumebacillus permanentifrigoris TaxID=378543 RepID=A0A316DEZ2_9BACL|nr:helix-turn-helix transcriptional regulator [Tumebacillus permanentifrigoris]PWK16148.1 helix-turn-helix protein [Tumebacillus permanentifrigoris]
MNELNRHIRTARKEQNLTAVQLADAIGVTKNYISDLETGKKANPTIQVVAQMAKVLNKPVNYFFGENVEDLFLSTLPDDVWDYIQKSIINPHQATLGTKASATDALVAYFRAQINQVERKENGS